MLWPLCPPWATSWGVSQTRSWLASWESVPRLQAPEAVEPWAAEAQRDTDAGPGQRSACPTPMPEEGWGLCSEPGVRTVRPGASTLLRWEGLWEGGGCGSGAVRACCCPGCPHPWATAGPGAEGPAGSSRALLARAVLGRQQLQPQGRSFGLQAHTQNGPQRCGVARPPAPSQSDPGHSARLGGLLSRRLPLRHLPAPQLLRQGARGPVRRPHRPQLAGRAGRLHLRQGEAAPGSAKAAVGRWWWARSGLDHPEKGR